MSAARVTATDAVAAMDAKRALNPVKPTGMRARVLRQGLWLLTLKFRCQIVLKRRRNLRRLLFLLKHPLLQYSR